MFFQERLELSTWHYSWGSHQQLMLEVTLCNMYSHILGYNMKNLKIHVLGKNF